MAVCGGWGSDGGQWKVVIVKAVVVVVVHMYISNNKLVHGCCW